MSFGRKAFDPQVLSLEILSIPHQPPSPLILAIKRNMHCRLSTLVFRCQKFLAA